VDTKKKQQHKHYTKSYNGVEKTSFKALQIPRKQLTVQSGVRKGYRVQEE
jgi:hypothetical protein